MHAVWRARQGIPWEPEQAKGMVANAGHISKVGAIGNFPAASPEDLTEAFGLRAAPKIVRAIDGSTAGPEKAALRKKAIAASMEMYRDRSRPPASSPPASSPRSTSAASRRRSRTRRCGRRRWWR